MKKLFYLFLGATMFITSCGEDDGGEPNHLIGNWTVTDAEATVSIDGKDMVEWFMDEFELTKEEAEEFIEFFGFDNLVEEFDGTVTFNDDGTYTSTLGDESDSGTWTMTDDTLTLSSSDGPDTMDIVTLNATTLVLSYTQSETEDLDDDGKSETMEITLELSFSK